MSSAPHVESLTTDSFSFYRTSHFFEKYGEFHTVEQFQEYYDWAHSRDAKLYILGNGSNTLFKPQKVNTLILKNKLDKDIKPLPNNRVEVSSSNLVIDVLKYCYQNSLDSFYYLASVPATIGGALAMNAGRGRQQNLTIYDFVESVTFFDPEKNCIRTLAKQDIVSGYRTTIFTGIQSCLILKAVFHFQPMSFQTNPIEERRKWSKEFQDYSAPNCGSVFKTADYRILRRLQGLAIGKTTFSAKTANWILNLSQSSFPILILINLVKLIHFVLRRKVELEVIVVE